MLGSVLKSSGNPKGATDKKIQRRQFYEICETTIRAMRESKPNVFYADKEKMFGYVLDRGILAADWKAAVQSLLSDPENEWIYTKIEDRKEGAKEETKNEARENDVDEVKDDVDEIKDESRSEDKGGVEGDSEYGIDEKVEDKVEGEVEERDGDDIRDILL